MARRLLPALRSLIESKDIEAGEQKAISFGTSYSSTWTGQVHGLEDRAAGWDMGTVVVEGYERAVWVFRCVEFIAGHSSRLPFAIGQERGTDDERIMEDHPLLRVMNKRANPLEMGRHFRKRLSQQVYLSKKGAFVEVTKSRMGTITRLDLLPPDRVRPMPDVRGDYLSHYEFYTRNGELREIEPERVRWIREPHPTDPFSGVTPLEPAGQSIELDDLSRRYNSAFIKNDGRPSGIVGVDTGGLLDEEAERIERRFRPGADHAGQITVLGTGPGGIKYVDTSTRPRDMAYTDASQNAKQEILSAFGLDESVLGNVAGRTWDNAEQALFNAWTEVIVPHLDLISAAFDGDVDEEWDPFIDTSSVEVLELPRRRRREEARSEWTAGLRSQNEYRPLAGLDPVDSAYARALWISPAKAPVPTEPGDGEELGLSRGGEQGAPTGPGEPPAEAGGTAADAVAEARADTGAGAESGTAAETVEGARAGEDTAGGPGGAADAVADARADEGAGGRPGDAAGAVASARTVEGKALAGAETKAADGVAEPVRVDYDPGDGEAKRVEVAAAGALDALLTRQAGVLAARLEAPKTRKGTRFWKADGPSDTRAGDRPIDAGQVTDADRWAQELTETLQPVVDPAAAEAGAGLLAAFAAAGLIAGSGQGASTGAAEGGQFTAQAAQAAARITLRVLTTASEAMRAWLDDVGRRIEVEQLAADSIEQIVDAVRGFYAEEAREFAESLAVTVAQATVNGAREATAASLTQMPGTVGEPTTGIVREWISRRDGKVRESHREVDGTVLPVGEPFPVGGFPLRFPGDPNGPPAQVRNCRCRAEYRTTKDARFLLPPVGSDES